MNSAVVVATLSPDRLHVGPVVVASAENTRCLTHVVFMLGHRHTLWLNLQSALVNVSCYLDSWPLPTCLFSVAPPSILPDKLHVNIVSTPIVCFLTNLFT